MNQEVLANNDEAGNAAAAPGGTGAAVKPIPEDAMILIPMRNSVLFPGVVTPVTVGRAVSVAAAQEAVRSEKRIGFLLQKDPKKNEVQPDDLYWVGTSGSVVRYITGPEGDFANGCRHGESCQRHFATPIA
jgi:ATP-dependent Lon protease